MIYDTFYNQPNRICVKRICAVARGCGKTWACEKNKRLLKQLKAHEDTRRDQQFFAEMTNNLANTCMRYMNLCYNETKDGYVFKIVDRKDRCAVIKTTVDENTSCIIKEFSDPDQDYNRLCAEELVEKLNEK